jgi:dihydrofolate reductase
MRISIIVAMSSDGLIGTDHGLPWRLPLDLKRFRELTWGKPVIMGRRTREAIGRPLPGRCNIVLTHDPEYTADGCRVAHSLPEALAVAQAYLGETKGDEVMIIGGAAVYRQALVRCDRVYLTVVEGRFAGNTYFPGELLGRPEWRVIREENFPADEKNPHAHWFYVLERRTQG